MVNPSRRGAARVNVVWLIVLIVAVLVAGALAIVGASDADTAREAQVAAIEEQRRATQRYEQERDVVRSLSEAVGYYDESMASARSEPAAISAGLNTLKDNFPDLQNASVKTFEAAVGPVVQAYKARGDEIRQLKQQLEEVRTEVAQKDAAMRELGTQKDQEIANLQSQLSDAEQAKADLQTELEQRIASVSEDLRDRDSKYLAAQNELLQKERSFDTERSTFESRFDEMSSKLAFLRQPEEPDGRVLAISEDLGLGWINLGAENRLARGMRFRVVSGRTGSDRVKAFAIVTRVERDMAEVRFVEQSDAFDPPLVGDIVYNPLFDPEGERYAVLVGRFSGSYNEQELRALLSGIGVTVQKSLDESTDYLIVGQEMYRDANDERLDEPLQPSDLPVYKEAQAMGVQIVPLKEIREYFKN